MSILAKLFGFLGGGDKKMAVIDRTLIGEALVGDGNEVAHIDLMMGPRGSAAESAFANALCNNKDGFERIKINGRLHNSPLKQFSFTPIHLNHTANLKSHWIYRRAN